MIKVKVNLLPKEIIDRRKAEKLIVFALAGVAVIAVALGFVYSYNMWRIGDAEREVAQMKEQATKMEASIKELNVYEQKMADIQRKQAVVNQAMINKIEWSKELEELMIVTPNDVSLSGLRGDSVGMTFEGTTLDSADSPDMGHKPVAKWLMRLADTSQKPDVWLTSSDKEAGSQTVKFVNTLKFKAVQAQLAQPVQAAQPAPSNSSGK